MYCPKCGTQNIENASFCRACGTNLSLVPQALTGYLPQSAVADVTAIEESRRARRRRRREHPPSLDQAIKNFVMGLGFIFVALAAKIYAPAGHIWWFWLLLPAFGMISSSLSEFVRLKQSPAHTALASPDYAPPAVGPAQRNELPPRPANADLYAPPTSVTENTTRLLDRDR